MHSLYRTLRTAIHALRRHIMQSALTCLGIVIGIASVTAVIAALTGRLTGRPSPLPLRPVVVVLGLVAAVPIVGAIMSREVAAALAFLSGGGAG